MSRMFQAGKSLVATLDIDTSNAQDTNTDSAGAFVTSARCPVEERCRIAQKTLLLPDPGQLALGSVYLLIARKIRSVGGLRLVGLQLLSPTTKRPAPTRKSHAT